jgi:tetratricopeptide (TPR) repeat protein
VGLWTPGELRQPKTRNALGRYQGVFETVYQKFSRSGADFEAAAGLYVLTYVAPANAKRYRQELREIFEYGDSLSIAEHGAGAQLARPIEILEAVAEFFLHDSIVDDLVRHYHQRQKLFDSLLRRSGADIKILAAHGSGVFRTAWLIVAVLARSERLHEAPSAIRDLVGVGDNGTLRFALERALSDLASEKDWLHLAKQFRDPDPEKSDYEAELAVAIETTRLFPKSAQAHLVAGKAAFDVGLPPVAAKHFEAGLALDGNHRPQSELLAALYKSEVAQLAAGSRIKTATGRLADFEAFHRRATPLFSDPIRPDPAELYAVMGRALLDTGDLGLAKRYLFESVDKRPTLTALEALATVEHKRGRHDQALSIYERALALPRTEDNTLQRNRVFRLASEAALGAGDEDKAVQLVSQAMKDWQRVLEGVQLSKEDLALLFIEIGLIQWRTNNREQAVMAFERAVDTAPDDDDLLATVVSFLLNYDQFEDALDAYHRALGSVDVSDRTKVYMSLWIVAESRLRGVREDPLARDFLAARSERLWHDRLAGLAFGKSKGLAAHANTPLRKHQLRFYSAILVDAHKRPDVASEKLQGTLNDSLLFEPEYDMAKHWLVRKLPRITKKSP